MTLYNLAGDISRTKSLNGDLKSRGKLSADLKIQFYSEGGKAYIIGHGLKLDESTNTLSVDTADTVEKDNTLPVTSAAVAATVGNIEVLLGTI